MLSLLFIFFSCCLCRSDSRDAYVLAEDWNWGWYSVQRVRLGPAKDGYRSTSVSAVVNSSETQGILGAASSFASNAACHALSSNGADWHFMTKLGDRRAVLTVHLQGKDKTSVHLLPTSARNDTGQVGCVWREESRELVMLEFRPWTSGRIQYLLTGVSVDSGAVRPITEFLDSTTVDYRMHSTDDEGRLYVSNAPGKGRRTYVVDGKHTDASFSKALVANVTVDRNCSVVSALTKNVIFLCDEGDSNDANFGSVTLNDFLKEDHESTVTVADGWTMPRPTSALATDDRTLFFARASEEAGPRSNFTLTECEMVLPLATTPVCAPGKQLATQVWAYATVAPPLPVTGGVPAAVIACSLLGAGVCAFFVYQLRKKMVARGQYTEV